MGGLVYTEVQAVLFDFIFLKDDALFELLVIAGEDSREFPVVNVLKLLIVITALQSGLASFDRELGTKFRVLHFGKSGSFYLINPKLRDVNTLCFISRKILLV